MAFNGNEPTNKRPRFEGRMDSEGPEWMSGSKNGDDTRRKRPENPENSVLLYTIFNPVYPITTDVLHTISSPSGKVVRIVIFKKTGVQAMVEFDSIESARRAKESLNGADIYSGCCTLKIEFAKPTRLNVHKNDAESWDYTLNKGGSDNNTRPPPLLQEPRYGAGPQPFQFENLQERRASSYDFQQDDHRDRKISRYDSRADTARPHYGNSNDGYNDGPAGGGGGSGYDRFSGDRYKNDFRNAAPAQQPSTTGSVMMVYGLDMKRINCERLFNLFCLYGNVSRIKFLKTKEGSAMIQMGDGLAVERCVQYLNNVMLTGKEGKLQLGFSKQPFLSDVINPYTLPDGTPSFKDYIGNKLNRFSNPAMSVKNRIQPPSKILHFFNTPPNIEEETLVKLFDDRELSPPSSVKVFPMKSERSSSGLMEFEEVQHALEALLILNHAPVDNPNGKFPYTMKLCFSSAKPSHNGINRYDD